MPDFSENTTCPYCSKTCRQGGLFDKHLHTLHADHVSGLLSKQFDHQKGFTASNESLQEISVISETPELDDFPLNLYPEETTSMIEENLGNHSDAVSEYDGINSEPEDSQPTRQQLYQNSGTLYGSVSGEVNCICDLI